MRKLLDAMSCRLGTLTTYPSLPSDDMINDGWLPNKPIGIRRLGLRNP
ncbi:hypothetical protein SLEP1_g53860 [Rubroshorea leprosula]|uniref:Uncharacterized protein n=1 Tax=Rubroshorea leprosula TaxID=152421 RepID=A0AAV5MDG4_9ROSI|nr:hypothetical protein SLEP1_g51668 [Rubroshorea leprosula]GKV46901.1 hypothetical protein SLEP1_g53860 [Rubroshorea leprosula]